MAFPPHFAFQFGGTLIDGADIWTNTIRFADEGTDGPYEVDEEEMLADLMSDLTARFPLSLAEGGLGYSTAISLEWGKFNQIGPTGGYLDSETTHMVELATPLVGNGTPPAYIPQIALAITWTTAIARGYANKGRIFLPMPGVAPQSSGHLSGGAPILLATNWGHLLEEFGDWPGIDPTNLAPSVVSNVQANGAKRFITGVRVGSVFDTMRSRRNALTEVYTSAPVEPAP